MLLAIYAFEDRVTRAGVALPGPPVPPLSFERLHAQTVANLAASGQPWIALQAAAAFGARLHARAGGGIPAILRTAVEGWPRAPPAAGSGGWPPTLPPFSDAFPRPAAGHSLELARLFMGVAVVSTKALLTLGLSDAARAFACSTIAPWVAVAVKLETAAATSAGSSSSSIGPSARTWLCPAVGQIYAALWSGGGSSSPLIQHVCRVAALEWLAATASTAALPKAAPSGAGGAAPASPPPPWEDCPSARLAHIAAAARGAAAAASKDAAAAVAAIASAQLRLYLAVRKAYTPAAAAPPAAGGSAATPEVTAVAWAPCTCSACATAASPSGTCPEAVHLAWVRSLLHLLAKQAGDALGAAGLARAAVVLLQKLPAVPPSAPLTVHLLRSAGCAFLHAEAALALLRGAGGSSIAGKGVAWPSGAPPSLPLLNDPAAYLDQAASHLKFAAGTIAGLATAAPLSSAAAVSSPFVPSAPAAIEAAASLSLVLGVWDAALEWWTASPSRLTLASGGQPAAMQLAARGWGALVPGAPSPAQAAAATASATTPPPPPCWLTLLEQCGASTVKALEPLLATPGASAGLADAACAALGLAARARLLRGVVAFAGGSGSSGDEQAAAFLGGLLGPAAATAKETQSTLAPLPPAATDTAAAAAAHMEKANAYALRASKLVRGAAAATSTEVSSNEAGATSWALTAALAERAAAAVEAPLSSSADAAAPRVQAAAGLLEGLTRLCRDADAVAERWRSSSSGSSGAAAAGRAALRLALVARLRVGTLATSLASDAASSPPQPAQEAAAAAALSATLAAVAALPPAEAPVAATAVAGCALGRWLTLPAHGAAPRTLSALLARLQPPATPAAVLCALLALTTPRVTLRSWRRTPSPSAAAALEGTWLPLAAALQVTLPVAVADGTLSPVFAVRSAAALAQPTLRTLLALAARGAASDEEDEDGDEEDADDDGASVSSAGSFSLDTGAETVSRGGGGGGGRPATPSRGAHPTTPRRGGSSAAPPTQARPPPTALRAVPGSVARPPRTGGLRAGLVWDDTATASLPPQSAARGAGGGLFAPGTVARSLATLTKAPATGAAVTALRGPRTGPRLTIGDSDDDDDEEDEAGQGGSGSATPVAAGRGRTLTFSDDDDEEDSDVKMAPPTPAAPAARGSGVATPATSRRASLDDSAAATPVRGAATPRQEAVSAPPTPSGKSKASVVPSVAVTAAAAHLVEPVATPCAAGCLVCAVPAAATALVAAVSANSSALQREAAAPLALAIAELVASVHSLANESGARAAARAVPGQAPGLPPVLHLAAPVRQGLLDAAAAAAAALTTAAPDAALHLSAAVAATAQLEGLPVPRGAADVGAWRVSVAPSGAVVVTATGAAAQAASSAWAGGLALAAAGAGAGAAGCEAADTVVTAALGAAAEALASFVSAAATSVARPLFIEALSPALEGLALLAATRTACERAPGLLGLDAALQTATAAVRALTRARAGWARAATASSSSESGHAVTGSGSDSPWSGAAAAAVAVGAVTTAAATAALPGGEPLLALLQVAALRSLGRLWAAVGDFSKAAYCFDKAVSLGQCGGGKGGGGGAACSSYAWSLRRHAEVRGQSSLVSLCLADAVLLDAASNPAAVLRRRAAASAWWDAGAGPAVVAWYVAFHSSSSAAAPAPPFVTAVDTLTLCAAAEILKYRATVASVEGGEGDSSGLGAAAAAAAVPRALAPDLVPKRLLIELGTHLEALKVLLGGKNSGDAGLQAAAAARASLLLRQPPPVPNPLPLPADAPFFATQLDLATVTVAAAATSVEAPAVDALAASTRAALRCSGSSGFALATPLAQRQALRVLAAAWLSSPSLAASSVAAAAATFASVGLAARAKAALLTAQQERAAAAAAQVAWPGAETGVAMLAASLPVLSPLLLPLDAGADLAPLLVAPLFSAAASACGARLAAPWPAVCIAVEPFTNTLLLATAPAASVTASPSCIRLDASNGPLLDTLGAALAAFAGLLRQSNRIVADPTLVAASDGGGGGPGQQRPALATPQRRGGGASRLGALVVDDGDGDTDGGGSVSSIEGIGGGGGAESDGGGGWGGGGAAATPRRPVATPARGTVPATAARLGGGLTAREREAWWAQRADLDDALRALCGRLESELLAPALPALQALVAGGSGVTPAAAPRSRRPRPTDDAPGGGAFASPPRKRGHNSGLGTASADEDDDEASGSSVEEDDDDASSCASGTAALRASTRRLSVSGPRPAEDSSEDTAPAAEGGAAESGPWAGVRLEALRAAAIARGLDPVGKRRVLLARLGGAAAPAAASMPSLPPALVLVLCEYTQPLPWESVPTLRGAAAAGLCVCRAPALALAHPARWASSSASSFPAPSAPFSARAAAWSGAARHGALGPHLPRLSPRAPPLAYVLNPGGDLPRTQAALAPVLEAYGEALASAVGVPPGTPPAWACVGREPPRETLLPALAAASVYVYCGHGAGESFLSKSALAETSSRVPPALLMGCSSGRLVPAGGLAMEPDGPALAFLLAGAPAVVGALWDVTDKDLDRYTKGLLELWPLGKGKVESATSSKSSGLAQALHFEEGEDNSSGGSSSSGAGEGGNNSRSSQTLGVASALARSECRLRYLVGAAPVCYGVPLLGGSGSGGGGGEGGGVPI